MGKWYVGHTLRPRIESGHVSNLRAKEQGRHRGFPEQFWLMTMFKELGCGAQPSSDATRKVGYRDLAAVVLGERVSVLDP